jgi:hypothetical protein
MLLLQNSKFSVVVDVVVVAAEFKVFFVVAEKFVSRCKEKLDFHKWLCKLFLKTVLTCFLGKTFQKCHPARS